MIQLIFYILMNLIKKKLAKKRCKRNYNEAFGEDNELIKFYDNLNLIKLNDMS